MNTTPHQMPPRVGRPVTSSGLSDLNKAITIMSDQPGNGNAAHNYQIKVTGGEKDHYTDIHFQDGAVKEVGLNGISDESLLDVAIDRLKGFQGGPFSCKENAVALTHLETAQLWLNKRTIDRMARGVEGKSQA